ncbi:6-aminohexanoate-cyclic-dimer hydrolase [Caldalkalibacillus thermarum]|nr:6-aminohexanoate-cyclic-dimer hydrolase [Caldalkalibacillus thermarum]
MDTSLLELDALAQAELVRNKQIHPEELLEAYLKRFEQLNPRLNAVITPMVDEARQMIREGVPPGPFQGVPFLLKDSGVAYPGVPLSSGSAMLKRYVPTYESELVTRYRQAGLVIVGKTNTPEFGLLATTEPLAFGPTLNPWDETRSAGGSSGGAAAAVAVGMVPMAHASDGGGSIRIPAAACGVFGFKPTRGRTPLGPAVGDVMNGLVSHHAVTRSVRDSAALLDATAGPAPGDPYWAPPVTRPYLQETKRTPGRLRVAFTLRSPFGHPIHEECIKAVQRAANLCQELGHEVEESMPDIDYEAYKDAFLTIWKVGCAFSVESLAQASGCRPAENMIEPLTRALWEAGKRISGDQYLSAVTVLQRLARQVAHFFSRYDVWLTPTMAEPPVPLGTFDSSSTDPDKVINRGFHYVPFTPLANATGQPAMSVPLYWSSSGLPIGTHFIGRFGDEATLFRLAAQLEQAAPWSNRFPPCLVM